MTMFMKGAEPVFLKGSDIGFLFIHGFTASPYEGREMAHWLHQKLGFTVSVPLLPGHGTRPDDLQGVTWQDWYGFVENQFLDLKNTCRQVFVCGQSMGAALALRLSANRSCQGIISLAGAVFLKDWRLLLLPLARHIVTYHYKSKGPDIRDKKRKAEIPNYPKYPVRSVDQLLALFEQVRNDLPGVNAPALLIHSRKDRTIHFSNLQYIYDHIGSSSKEMVVLEESYHVISIDIERELVFERIERFINKNML
ncbi:MAG: alpha/beta fold hydrolase [bacterium]|nr:MAG: alpha/beta fold hydrolase [bacterium]